MSTRSAGFLDLTLDNETGDDLVDHFHIDAEQEPDGAIKHFDRDAVQIWKREGRPIGSGGFGTAWLEREAGGNMRVVKEVKKVLPNIKKRYWVRELSTLALLSKNKTSFPEFYGWFQDDTYVYIAMEHFASGDLQQCVGGPLPTEQSCSIVGQVSTALEVMHRRRITHRDLKPANILVRHTGPLWQVAVSDFGVSKRVRGVTTALHTSFEGDFMAPEILGFVDDGTSGEYTSAVDLWSLGCLAYWLLTMNMPVPRRRMMAHCNRSWTEAAKDIDMADFDETRRDFILSLLKPDPQQRMTATQARVHNWLKSGLKSSAGLKQPSKRPGFTTPVANSNSSPMQPVAKPTNITPWAIEAANETHKDVTSPASQGDPRLETTSTQFLMKDDTNREFYTSYPTVAIDVQEKNSEGTLRAPAVAMAEKMYAIQQKQVDEAASEAAGNDDVLKDPNLYEGELQKGAKAIEASQNQPKLTSSVPMDSLSAVHPGSKVDKSAAIQILSRQRLPPLRSADGNSSLLHERSASDDGRSSDNAQSSPEGLKPISDTDEIQKPRRTWDKSPSQPASATNKSPETRDIIDFATEHQVQRENAKKAAQRLVVGLTSSTMKPLTEQQNRGVEEHAWSSLGDEQVSQLRKDVGASRDPAEPYQKVITKEIRQRNEQRPTSETWLTREPISTEDLANQSVRLKEERLRREEDKLTEIEVKVQREIEEKRRKLLARESQLRELEARLQREQPHVKELKPDAQPQSTRQITGTQLKQEKGSYNVHRRELVPRGLYLNPPKRGLPAYMFFANDQRDTVTEENPGISFGQLGKVLGEKWNALSEKQRAPYEAKAAADKKRYEEEKAKYNKRYEVGEAKYMAAKTDADGSDQVAGTRRTKPTPTDLMPSKTEGVHVAQASAGFASTSSVRIHKQGIILKDFTARATNEVTVVVGEEVIVLDDTDDTSEGWWRIQTRKNNEGLIPSSYVKTTATVRIEPSGRSGVDPGLSSARRNKASGRRPDQVAYDPRYELLYPSDQAFENQRVAKPIPQGNEQPRLIMVKEGHVRCREDKIWSRWSPRYLRLTGQRLQLWKSPNFVDLVEQIELYDVNHVSRSEKNQLAFEFRWVELTGRRHGARKSFAQLEDLRTISCQVKTEDEVIAWVRLIKDAANHERRRVYAMSSSREIS